ncbi:MAG: hypothetical protein VX498_11925, partial [Myxococcota bacterium]|nr:hypothetical protein [Myxococcota bacterium]
MVTKDDLPPGSSGTKGTPSLFGEDPPEAEQDSAEESASTDAPDRARRGPGRLARGLARRVRDRLKSVGSTTEVASSEARDPRGHSPQASSPSATASTAGPQGGSDGLDPKSAAARKKRTSSRDNYEAKTGPAPVSPSLPTISSTAELDPVPHTPRYLLPEDQQDAQLPGRLSCSFCGVGDSGVVRRGERDGSTRIETLGSGTPTGGRVGRRAPTKGCSKLQIAAGQRGTLFPIHTAPSIKDRYSKERRSISYEDAIKRLADLALDHRDPDTQILLYGCGQIDYFTVFAMQEVFRLLGVRNVAGNAEHCLNAGAVHNEMLTGQEGPFLTFDTALDGPNRFFILNGWNGMLTHPGVWHRLIQRRDFDGYVIEVMETETARWVGQRLGEERLLLVRSGSDPHLALGIAHELLHQHHSGMDERFLERYSDAGSWRRFNALAREDRFSPAAVAERIAPEPRFAQRLGAGIRDIAARIVDPDTVPINIPSVGLSQSKGAVPHCLWGNAMALAGKYGLKADGSPAGGTLRVAGQINAESEIQGLSRLFFFGRIPVDDEGATEAARRMGLPDDSYELAVRDQPRPVLDYSISDNQFDRELIIAFGTQFEANMMDRNRWVKKLERPGTTLVVVDPIPDPFSLDRAHLVIPSPPHAATPKLYQNGEWRLTLSVPDRKAPPETRSDATILYDMMAEISRRIREDSMLRMIHPDLGFHSQSGYLRERFEDSSQGGSLPRIDGEVSRAHLWARVLDYLGDGPGRTGPLYCLPTHADGRTIQWSDLLEAGHLIYGGVGSTRYRLDYDDPDHVPFRDIYGRPGSFEFFVPSEDDLRIPVGTVLNSGRSALSDDPTARRFAVETFNSGKASPGDGMPEEHPVYVSAQVAEHYGINDGQQV